jgi:hypothetical protein
MTDKAISPLRQRMIEDMTMRKLAPKTQHDYVQRVKNFAGFLGRSPDTASFEDVRRYQLHLAASGAGVPTPNQSVSHPVYPRATQTAGCAAAPRRSAGMSRVARSVRTAKSRTTLAATDIARSARVRRQRTGWLRVRPTCCRCRTSMSCSPCRLPEQDRHLQLAVQGICRDPDHDRGRPKTPRRPRRHHLGSPYLGFAHDPSPARPHDRARRRHLARRQALGGLPVRLLPAGARALAPVPTAVPGEAPCRTPGRPPEVLRRSRRSRRRAGARGVSRPTTPIRMGGPCQAPVRRATDRNDGGQPRVA